MLYYALVQILGAIRVEQAKAAKKATNLISKVHVQSASTAATYELKQPQEYILHIMQQHHVCQISS